MHDHFHLTDCWKMVPVHNAIYGLIPHTSYEKRPKIFKFPVTPNYTVCQQYCDREPGCYAFANTKSDACCGYAGICFGRGFGNPETLVADHGVPMSGVKIC